MIYGHILSMLKLGLICSELLKPHIILWKKKERLKYRESNLSLCVCVSVEEIVRLRERREKGRGRQWLSQRSYDLIKAIHHIKIIRQQHESQDQQPSCRTHASWENSRAGSQHRRRLNTVCLCTLTTVTGKTRWHKIQTLLVSEGVGSSSSWSEFVGFSVAWWAIKCVELVLAVRERCKKSDNYQNRGSHYRKCHWRSFNVDKKILKSRLKSSEIQI